MQGSAHTVSYVNSAFCRLVGKTRAELSGRPFAEIVPGGDECVSILDSVYQTGKAAAHAREDDSENNPAYWLYAMWPALDAHERPAGVIIQLTKAANFRQDVTAINEALLIAGLRQHELTEAADKLNAQLLEEITERKAVDEALRAAMEREKLARADADTANRSKDLFLATLSHEMRTPLNSVLGWVSVLRRAAYNQEDVREGLEVIERSAKAQARLIEDVLDVSRIIAGKLQLDIRPADLVSIIHAAVDVVRHAAQTSGVRLEMELDASAACVPCDAARMQQVLLNLLSNSIKFSRKGGFVKVTLSRDGSRARIAVADNGKGIKSDFLPHVFERYRQAEGGITRNYGGLGLGLSIVKTLVALHFGTVEARSEGEGRGATFIISLPIEPVAAVQGPHDPGGPGVAKAFADPSPIHLDEVRVLIVDDQPDARDLLARVLEGFGARAATAGSVAEALAVLPGIRPRVLISDIAMPHENGFDLIRQVRALGYSAKDLPAVALTAYVQPEDRLNATMAGFQVHVPKPVDPYNLIAVIASLAAGVDVNSPA